MSKKRQPKNSSKPPKRSRKRNKQSLPDSGASKPELHTPTEKKQVSPLVATLILAPLLAILVYGGYQLLNPATGEQDPVDPQPNNVSSKDDRSISSASQSPSQTSTGRWETGASLADKWDRIDNPAGDGWDTEVFNQRVTSQLKALKKKLLNPAKIDSGSLSSLVASDVKVGLLRPTQPALAWEDEQFQVYRSSGSDNDVGLGGSDRGAMVNALQKLVGKFAKPAELRSKIKVFRIKESEEFTETWQTVELFGQTDRGLEEENMVWRAQWQLDETGRYPLLSQVTFEKYEGVVRPGSSLFSDCTESIFSNNDRFQNQLLVGYNQILQRCQVNDYYVTLGNPGLALGDVNNDGLDDLFLCQENGVPNMLLIQNPDGSLKDFTDQSGVNWLQNCRTALIVDLDNDGNNDMVVAYTGGVVVASGDGTGQFQIQKYLETGGDVLALSAADYDLDGRLDLFVGVYGADGALLEQQQLTAAGGGGAGFVYVDAKDGGRNSMFHNECDKGNWQFRDVTDEIGLGDVAQRYSQAAAWADFDNDGDQDLYVANDFGPNNLLRNDTTAGGKRYFTDVAKEAGARDSASGMSVDWADFDRDGWLDVYVGNMYSYAGNRIVAQNQFKPDQTNDVIGAFQRFARGNTLMRNNGTAEGVTTFDDQSLPAAVNRGRWAWGSRFVDLNNDGWQDLVVANGFITADDSGDL